METLKFIMERTFSNLQTKITTLSMIFEFPNNKAVIIQCPEVIYKDITDYSKESTFSTSFNYQFIMNQFIIQVLEKKKNWDTTLEFGNNVIYSNEKDTIINVTLKPPRDDHYSFIEVSTLIPSFQGLMNTNQVNILQDIFKKIQESVQNEENYHKDRFKDDISSPRKDIEEENIILSDDEKEIEEDEFKDIETPQNEKEQSFKISSKNQKMINFTFEFKILNSSSIKLLYNDMDTKKNWLLFEKFKDQNKEIMVENPCLEFIIKKSYFKISKLDSLLSIDSKVDLRINERINKDEVIEILAPQGKKGLFEIIQTQKIFSKIETKIIFNEFKINLDLTIIQRLQQLYSKLSKNDKLENNEIFKRGKLLNYEENEKKMLEILEESEKETDFSIDFNYITLYLLFRDKDSGKYKQEKIKIDLDTLKLKYSEQMNLKGWNVIIDNLFVQFIDDIIFKTENMNVIFNMKTTENILTPTDIVSDESFEQKKEENKDLDEKENLKINRLKHINGKFNIEINSNISNLCLTKKQIETLNNLFNDLIQSLVEKNSIDAISDNLIDSTKFEDMYQSGIKSKSPLLSLRFEFQELILLIKDLEDSSKEKHDYKFKMTNLIFYNFSYSDLMEMYISNENFVFNEETNHEKKPLIRRYQRLVKDYRNNEKSSLLCDIKITSTPITNVVSIKSQLNGLLFNHYNGNNNWIQILSSNFNDILNPSSISPFNSGSMNDIKPKTISLDIILQDIALDYIPDDINSRMIINFDKIAFSTILLTDSNLKKFDLELYDINIMLNDHIKVDIIEEILYESERTLSFERDLEVLNFVRVGSLHSLELTFKIDPYQKELPDMNLEIQKGSLKLYLCNDSLNTFITTLKSFIPSLIIFDSLNESKQKEEVKKEEIIEEVKKEELKEEIKKEELKDKKEELKEDKKDETKKEKDGFKIPFTVIENHFALDDTIRQKLSVKFGRPEFELLISNFEIISHVHAGKDWNNTRDQNFIKISFLDVFLQYDICKTNWKLSYSINNIEIKDEIKSSERNLLLSYFKTDKYPRGDNQKMLNVEIENDSNDLNLLIEILPLRVNFHQESFDFLKNFISEMTPKEKVEEVKIEKKETFSEKEFNKLQYPYFKNVKISDIVIRFHYQPVKLSFESFKQGDYTQLLNIIPLNGVDIIFDEINLKGLYGNDVVNSIIEKMKRNSQSFDFIIRILPVNSFIYIGSGVFDLIMLPVINYKEGQLLRGMKNGLSSFVKKFSLGGINLTTSTFDGTNGALKMLGSYLGTENDENRTQLPSGAKEGILEGYSSLKLGFGKALNSMMEIPKDYESKGAQGVAIQTVKSIPTIVFSPLVGTTEGISKFLHGIQSWMDPNIRDENKALFK